MWFSALCVLFNVMQSCFKVATPVIACKLLAGHLNSPPANQYKSCDQYSRSSNMRAILHPSVAFLDSRLRIWQGKAAKMGMQLVKYTAETPLTNGDKLVIGSDWSVLEQAIRDKLPDGHYLVVRDSWIEACMLAGTDQVPILPHIVPVSQLQPAAAAAAAPPCQQLNTDRRSMLKRRIFDDDSDTNAGPTPPAAEEEHQAKRNKSLIDNPIAAAAPPPPPPPPLADNAVGPMKGTSLPVSAATIDALRVITGRRLWAPARQHQQIATQQQQQQGQITTQQQQQISNQQQDLLIFQQQQRPLPRLDISWMGPAAIRVVSYNLLADMYCSKGATKSYCAIHLRQWSSRWPRIAAELAAYQPHIICLQEVDDHLWPTDIEPWLRANLNMQGLVWNRTYSRNKGTNEGVALCYNRSRFKLLHHQAVRFADHIPQTTDPGLVEFWASVSDYEEGAIFALLQDTATHQIIVACCTHLWFSPKTPDIKVGQADLLCKCCVEFIQQQCRESILAWISSSSCRGKASSSSRLDAAAAAATEGGQAATAAAAAAGGGSGSSHNTGGADTGKSAAAAGSGSSTKVLSRQRGVAASSGVNSSSSNSDKSEGHQSNKTPDHPHTAAGSLPAAAALSAAGPAVLDVSDLLHDVPVVIAGDFNSLWRKYKSDAFDRVPPGQHQTSGVYELLSTGQLLSSHPHHPSYRHGHNRNNTSNNTNRLTAVDAPAGVQLHLADGAAAAAPNGTKTVDTRIQDYVFSAHGLQLQSSYLAARGYEPAVTNKHPGFAGCLDYVWFSKQKLMVAGTLAMPYETLGLSNVPEDPERVPFVSIPDDVWPSDHLAVGAVLEFQS